MTNDHIYNADDEVTTGRDWLKRGFAALKTIASSRRIVENTEKSRKERERWRQLIAVYAAGTTGSVSQEQLPSVEDGALILAQGAATLRALNESTASETVGERPLSGLAPFSDEDMSSMSKEKILEIASDRATAWCS